METRDLHIKICNDQTGEVIYEHPSFNGPASWSDTAITILASRYAKPDEDSVQDVVNRIVNRITSWMNEQGYIGDSEEWCISNQLCDILIGQKAAFNTPIWVNLGSNKEMCAACFLADVEDNMNSIMDHTKVASMIYKNSAGVGLNVSNLRGKGETLSSGGESSGPISFMRVWDRAAGAVKSGGRTRRAAALITMDADHPDIEEFIKCKSAEEKKAKALIAAGISRDEAYNTVDFQNANHSIGVSDAFMKAVKEDKDWWLLKRVASSEANDGGISKVAKAKELFRLIAQSAWETGDPGLQFLDTVNRYNPVQVLGIIKNSNPCGEIYGIPWSSCLLCSFNLVKYLVKTETNSYKIDYATLRSDLRTITFAMDAMIDKAYYPDERFAEVAKKTRPLGIGISNLGGALALLGLSYDSDEGRKWAADTMAFILACVKGASNELVTKYGFAEIDYMNPQMRDSYGGYRNSQFTCAPPTGTIGLVMDCDSTGCEPIFARKTTKKLIDGSIIESIPRCLQEAQHPERTKTANEIHWKDHIKMVAALQPHISGGISKCVTGDTLICTDKGIKTIKSFHQGEAEDSFRDINLGVASVNGTQIATSFYYGGTKNIIKLTLKDGRILKGTPNHKIRTINADGEYKWERLDRLTTDDFVAICLGTNIWAKEPLNIDYKQELYGYQKEINIPKTLSVDLAWLLGIYIAEGNKNKSNWSIAITNNNINALNKAQRIVKELFNIDSRICEDKRTHVTNLSINSKSLCLLLDYLGCNGLAEDKEIPWSILQSPKHIVSSFIAGLWFDGYVPTNGKVVAICLKSETLIRQLQTVLTNFGIKTGISKKFNKKYLRYYYVIQLSGEDLLQFNKEFAIEEQHKITNLQKHCSDIKNYGLKKSASNVIPNIKTQIMNLVRDKKAQKYFRISKSDGKNLSRQKVEEIYHMIGTDDRLEFLKEVFNNNIIFKQIKSIEYDTSEVYDFYVPTNNTFIGNGIINHNTINMPNNTTVEDVEEAFMMAYDLGLKGITIYRDGSKSWQPLNETKEEDLLEEEDEEDEDIEQDKAEWTAIQRKVPDEISLVRHKFNISGVKGYIKAGTYPDTDSLCEVWLKVSKSGSLINGLLDSLAIVWSLALQYGVPLEKLVDNLSSVKFEPSGWTTNPEIPSCSSIVDYVCKWLELKFISRDKPALIEPVEFKFVEEQPEAVSLDGPLCQYCGNATRRSGTCFLCTVCGSTTGCS